MMLGCALCCLVLSGCTDPNSWSEQSDSDENEPDDALVEDVPVEPFSLKYGPKTFRFSWLEDDQATHYRLLENPDGVSGFTQIGLDLPAGTLVYDHAVTLYRRVNARYLLQRCRDTECETHGTLDITNTLKAAIGYFKASHIGEYHFFGISVAISGDGTTLAVGAYGESGSGTGIDPVADALAENAGAVFVFKLEDGAWVQQAYIKSFNTRPWDEFGRSVALSDDGNVLAVGAMFEYSPGTGINPPFTAAGFRSGAVYVYERTGDSWAEQTYIKAGHQIPGNPTYYGISVDLSADGSTLVVGASGEPSEVHGINPVPSGYDFWSGAAFVYQRNAGTWVQEAFIKSSATNPVGGFGRSVSLNGDGNILAVGGDGNTVHVYSRNGADWSQQALVRAEFVDSFDKFGWSVSLDDAGDTLAVGAPGEESAAGGVGAVEDDLSDDTGAAYVFERTGTSWQQVVTIKTRQPERVDLFGWSVSLSGDGETLAVGMHFDKGRGFGINPTVDGTGFFYGGAQVYDLVAGSWTDTALVRSGFARGKFLEFGRSLSLSNDGDTLAVGAPSEDGARTGINPELAGTIIQSGAVYLY